MLLMNDMASRLTDLYGPSLVRWLENHLITSSDDFLALLEGEVPGSGRPGFPDQMTRAEWTRKVLENKLMILRQWYLKEPETYDKYVPGKDGHRGEYVKVTVKKSVTFAFNSFQAPRDAMWLNDYRRRVIEQDGIAQDGAETARAAYQSDF